MGVVQHPPADALDHRPVPCHERGKGVLVTLPDELVEQGGVRGGIGVGSGDQAAEVVQQTVGRGSHDGGPRG